VVIKIVVAVVAALVMLRLGVMVLRGLSHVPADPESGALRKVNLRFRCSICGAEVRMVQAAEELPAPPRHCQEDMDLVAPLFD
jgi:hypothetical protein